MDTEKCQHCDKVLKKTYMRCHIARFHTNHVEPRRNSRIECVVCHEKFLFRQLFRVHVHKTHAKIVLAHLRMESMDEFKRWLQSEEQRLQIHYVRKNQSQTLVNGFKHYRYYCQYDSSDKYEILSQEQRKRALKSQGSYKLLHASCPAGIDVEERENGDVIVKYYKTHLGHDASPEHFFLSKEERQQIAEKLKTGISFDRFLDEAKNNSSGNLNRKRVITRKTLWNIAGRKRNSCEIDITSVHLWIEGIRHAPNNPVCYYKPRGVKMDDFAENDFILIIITEVQVQVLKEFGNKVVCVDSTGGTNQYNFRVTSVIVVDDHEEGFPVAFCLSNVLLVDVMRVLFREVRSKVNLPLTPPVFMSDNFGAYYNIWIEIMGPEAAGITKEFLTPWHVMKNWRKNLDKIGGDKSKKGKQDIVFKMLRMLLGENDESFFLEHLGQVITDLMSDEDTILFGEYFKREWVRQTDSWAYCYHIRSGININMRVENLLRSVKVAYNQSLAGQKLDSCLFSLLKIVRDKHMEWIIEHMKVNAPYITSVIEAAHRRGFAINDADVEKKSEKEQTSFTVKSQTDNYQVYEVLKIHETCPNDCDVICQVCEICIHIYSCTCLEYLIRGHMCRHIHKVCYQLKMEKNMSATPSYADDESSDQLDVLVHSLDVSSTFDTPDPESPNVEVLNNLMMQISSLLETNFNVENFEFVKKHFELCIARLLENSSDKIVEENSNENMTVIEEIEPQQKLHSTKRKASSVDERSPKKPTHNQREQMKRHLESYDDRIDLSNIELIEITC